MMEPPSKEEMPVDWGMYIKLAIGVFLGLLLPMLLPASLVSIVVIFAGLLWLLWGGWIIYLSAASKSWPATQGIIVENRLGGIEVPGRGPAFYADYFPVIAYRYIVDGVEYLSRRIALFPSDLRTPEDRTKRPPCKDAADFCANYPLNSSAAVYYNPKFPKDAVLIVGALSRSKQHSIVFLVLGSFLVLLGTFVFCVTWMQ